MLGMNTTNFKPDQHEALLQAVSTMRLSNSQLRTSASAGHSFREAVLTPVD